jgi:pimeloyl-ACP methyl ester carboxylesterase
VSKTTLRNEIATPEAGVRRVDFIRREGSFMFVTLHLPKGTPREGIVICSSINADHSKLYRAEVRLSAALAAQGFAVMRFHYTGQGHSGGDAGDITFESLLEDALAAAQTLRSETRVAVVSFIGCRMGAFVAGVAAAGQVDSRLVLWEPIVDPTRYVREAQRSMSMSRMSGSETHSSGSDSAAPSRDGSLDVHGYRISKRLISSLEGRGLTLGDNPRALLLVQISRRQELSASYAALMEEWRRDGRSADSCCVSGEIAWWFRGVRQGREETEAVTERVIAATVGWLAPTPNITVGVG